MTNQKHKIMVQAIDGFTNYLPTGDFKKDLIDPVLKGVKLEDQLQYLADYIWDEMHQGDNPNILKTKGIYGKKEYFPEGNWNGKYLRIDILGEDSQIYFYLKDRIRNFINMVHEYNLLNTLQENTTIFKEVNMADEQTDKFFKIDLIATDYEDCEWYISVYKSSDEKAISKMNTPIAKSIIDHRLIYNVNKSGSPKIPQNIKKWEEEVINYKHALWLENNNWLVS